MNLESKLEAILFYRGEPVTEAKLAAYVNASVSEVSAALDSLAKHLAERGMVLLRKDGEATLATHPDADTLIANIAKEELSRDLGNAGLETLSIILYRGPITRSGIDYIRGVNSTFILRNLMVRGLVEKIPNPEDQRSFLYRASFELLAHLGISRVEELPQYGQANESIDAFIGEIKDSHDGTASSTDGDQGSGDARTA